MFYPCTAMTQRVEFVIKRTFIDAQHKELSIKPTNPKDLISLQEQFFNKLKGMGRSTNTLKNYRTDLDCFNHYIKEILGKSQVDISNFDIPNIEAYGSYLQTKYNSDNSRRRRVQALRIFFDFLVEKKYVGSNPVKRIPTSPKFLDIPRPTPFSDIKTLWQYLLEEADKNETISMLIAKRNMVTLLLIYGAGLKVSDLVGIREKHIFAQKDKSRVLVEPAKRDPYTVPLPDIFYTIYQDYQLLLSKVKKENNLEFDEILFNANPYRILSGGLSTRGLEIIFEEFRKKLVIHSTPKSLRQACIFKWLKQNKKDSQIKEWLGLSPSYNLKLYKDHLSDHLYDEEFLEELYLHYIRKGHFKGK